MAGFSFEEVLSGSFRRHDTPRGEHPMSIAIRARSRTPRGLAPSRLSFDIDGAIDIDGFAEARVLRGTITLDRLRDGRARYAFTFADNDGSACVFEGERAIRRGEIHASFSLLTGVVRSSSASVELGRAVLRFDTRYDLVRLLGSLRAWL